MAGVEVKLGERSYGIVAQPIGYLNRALGPALADLSSMDVGGGNIADVLGERAYGVLKVFIPKLMPEWEWRGFASQRAADEDEYDADQDRSPSFDQIVEAFETAMRVNRLDLFKHLGKLLGPEFLRAAMQKTVAQAMIGSSDSPTSAAQSTDGPSTTSPETPPTSSESAAAPSPALSGS